MSRLAPNNSVLSSGPARVPIDIQRKQTLANIQSAKKRARQNLKRRLHNVALRSRMRSAIKKVLKSHAEGDKEAAQAEFKTAMPAIDRMASKGLIRKNRAAQYKSRLNAKLKAMPG